MQQRRVVVLAVLALGVYAQPSVAGPAPPATLTIEKQSEGSSVPSPPGPPAGAFIPGLLVTYTNTAENEGPSAVLNMTISDPLPAQSVFISAVASPGASLTTPAVGTNGNVISVWDAAGGTPAGLTAADVVRTLTIVSRVCPEATCSDLTNTATVSTDTVGVPSDEATTTDPLFPESNLSISKTASVDRVNAGGSFTYTLNVANAGPSNSATTRVVDTLPPGLAAIDVSTSIPGAICGVALDGGSVVCNFALGAANQCLTNVPTSGQILIEVQVSPNSPTGPAVNMATIGVSGDCGYDPATGDNTAFATVLVLDPAGVPALSQIGLATLATLLGIAGMWMLGRRRAQAE